MGNKVVAVHTFTMSLGELWALLFKKKICRACGAALVRHRRGKDLGVGWHRDETTSTGVQFDYGRKTVHRFVYVCDTCQSEVELAEL